MRGNWGMSSWKNVVYAHCAGSLQVGPPREECACHQCQTEGPTALGFWNIQDQIFTTYSTCLLPDKAGCVTVLAMFLQLSQMHLLGGVKTYGVAGISGGGGTYG